MPTSMPSIVPPDIEHLQAEVSKWDSRATVLYRSYVIAMVATVAAVGGVLFLMAEPVLGPMFGDAYFFGSPSV